MIHLRKLSNIGRRCSNLHANSISSLALLRPSLTPPSQGNNKYQLVSRKRISTDTIIADALVSDAVAPQLGWSLSHIAMYTVDQVISSQLSPLFRLVFLNTTFKPFLDPSARTCPILGGHCHCHPLYSSSHPSHCSPNSTQLCSHGCAASRHAEAAGCDGQRSPHR